MWRFNVHNQRAICVVIIKDVAQDWLYFDRVQWGPLNRKLYKHCEPSLRYVLNVTNFIAFPVNIVASFIGFRIAWTHRWHRHCHY